MISGAWSLKRLAVWMRAAFAFAAMPRVALAKAGTLPAGSMKVSLSTRPISYRCSVPPTIVRDGQFRLFFFSREESRIHVHVGHPQGEAKFWLSPEVVVAVNVGLSPMQLRQARAVVVAHLPEIEDAWRRHFGR